MNSIRTLSVSFVATLFLLAAPAHSEEQEKYFKEIDCTYQWELKANIPSGLDSVEVLRRSRNAEQSKRSNKLFYSGSIQTPEEEKKDYYEMVKNFPEESTLIRIAAVVKEATVEFISLKTATSEGGGKYTEDKITISHSALEDFRLKKSVYTPDPGESDQWRGLKVEVSCQWADQ